MRWTMWVLVAAMAAGCSGAKQKAAGEAATAKAGEADPHGENPHGHAHDSHAHDGHGADETAGAHAAAPAEDAPSEGSICGEIQIAPALASKVTKESILFVFSKPHAGGGPPAAVIRRDAPTFPVSFCLSQKNSMAPAVRFEGKQYLTARVEFDDNAGGRAGDLEVVSDEPVPVGTEGVVLVIDTVRK